MSFLKTSDSATFGQVSASVSSIKMTAKSNNAVILSPSTWITTNIFGGSVAGALVVGAIFGCIFGYYSSRRNGVNLEVNSHNRSFSLDASPDVVLFKKNYEMRTSPDFQVSNPIGRESLKGGRGRHVIRGLPSIDAKTSIEPLPM